MDSKQQFSHFLLELLYDYSEGIFNPEFDLVDFKTDDPSVLTENSEGFIAKTSDGANYHISVMQTK